jgi:hypothetical protein
MQHSITIGDMPCPATRAYFVDPSKNEKVTQCASTFFVGIGKEPVMERLLSSEWKKTLQEIFQLKFHRLILILLHERQGLA